MNSIFAGQGESVLVVEVNAAAVLGITQALQSLGYDPVVALNMLNAILALDQPVDVLMTEIALPEFDGFMLADMAKSHRPAIAVVYTAANMEKAERSLQTAGQLHGPILSAPYTLDQLQAAIARARSTPMSRAAS